MAADAERYERLSSAFYARLAYLTGDHAAARTHLEKADRNEQYSRSLLMFLDLRGGQYKQTAHYQIYVDAGLAKAGALATTAETKELVYAFYSKMFPIKVEKLLQPIVILSDRAKYNELYRVLEWQEP